MGEGRGQLHIFVTREEVPRLTVTWTGELAKRRTAWQVEPGGMEELRRRELIFINIKILISNISAFSGTGGTFGQKLRTFRL